MDEPLRVGSLFSGIGGLDLGLERAGMRVEWQCEIEPFCRAVLAHHWPGVHCYEDIRDIDGNAPRVDLLCGGFPCQPVSLAGKGLAQEDPRWLWPEFARVIGLLLPRYVLMENVPGLATRGLGDVLGSLAALGYDAERDIVSAAAVGAPHLRERIFVIAVHSNPNSGGFQVREELDGDQAQDSANWRPRGGHPDGLRDASPRWLRAVEFGLVSSEEVLADPERPERGQETERGDVSYREDAGREETPGGVRAGGRGGGEGLVADPDSETRGAARSPSEEVFRPEEVERLGRCRSRLGEFWAVEPGMGRVAHGVPNRVAQLRALGNAVVPQVAEFVGRLVVSAEEARRAA